MTADTLPFPTAEPAAPARIVVATDGSCLKNPGPGGWAAAVVIGDRWADAERWVAGSERHTTNNAMELTAIAATLHAFRDHPGELVIVTDSRYAIDALTKWVKGWKRRGWRTGKNEPVKNQEEIQLADALLEHRRRAGHGTSFRWVRGHAGHEANEFVDDRARRAATAAKSGAHPPTGPGLIPPAA